MDDSEFIIPMGQSGHVFSPDYDAYLARWLAVEYIPMTMVYEVGVNFVFPLSSPLLFFCFFSSADVGECKDNQLLKLQPKNGK